MANIAVIGCGYVGLGTSSVFAEFGHTVVGVDNDPAKVMHLQEGECPIFEPGLQELLHRGLSAGRLSFTTEYAEAVPSADFVFICVSTPCAPHGGADMQYVRQAARSIGRQLSSDQYTIVVNKSTMPPGSGDLVGALLGEEADPRARFSVVANPEFLREGSAVRDMMEPDRIVLGAADRAAAEAVAGLYPQTNAPVVIADLRTAEMIKYAANAFLATRISFVNEIAQICEALGADVRQVAQGIGLDKRIGPHFLNAGVGFGGSCFPKDAQALEYIGAVANCYPRLLRSVLEINRDSRRSFVAKLDKLLGGLDGRTIAVWGLAFKPNTDDLREAPALDIIREMMACGAQVRVYDPAAMEGARRLLPRTVAFCENAYEAAEGSDAIALVTEWNEFKALDLVRVRELLRRPVLVDGRNIYDPHEMASLGFIYRGVGVPIVEAVELPVQGVTVGLGRRQTQTGQLAVGA